MAHPRFIATFSLLSLMLVAGFVSAAPQESDQCSALRRDLTAKRQQLLQHVDALKKLGDQNEFAVMAVFNEKIRELIEEIQKIDASLRDCPPELSVPRSPGLDTVKSDPAEYATKTCDELRNLFLQLVHRTTALKRREGSLFSPLTPSERSEIEDAEKSFKELKSAMRHRCGSLDEQSPFRRKRR